MIPEQRKIIEREFYNYRNNKKLLSEKSVVAAVAYSSAALEGERVKTSLGNNTEQLIIRAIYNEDRIQRWCTVFEKTLEKFKWENKDKLIQKRYIERKSVWRTCDEVGIERRTYFYWLDDILQTAAMWAYELKLF